MLEIIPAIDIIDGQCVRLSKGEYASKKMYHSNPLEVAKSFEDAGIKRLHLVDLDGAKKKEVVNLKVLESIARGTNLTIDFGGGVQSDLDIENVFSAGASQVTGGSIAVKKPELFSSWLQKYGSDKIILGADTRNGKVAISGWEEDSSIEVIDFVQSFVEQGISYIISTDVLKDGMLQGPSMELYHTLCRHFPEQKIIASGGVSTIQDIYDLAETPVYGVILGKAIYENKITLKQLTEFQLKQN